MSEEGRAVCRNNAKKMHTTEAISRMSQSLTGRKLAKEHIRKSRISSRPTSLERLMIDIIGELGLPYKYTGDGAVKIDGLNPDFINIDGLKIALEVYTKIYKEIDGRSIQKWKAERSERFSKHGWVIWYFDESQVNINYVRNILGGDSH
jgi:hypothetical protein